MYSPEWDSFGILSTKDFSTKAKYTVTFDKKGMCSWSISEYQKYIIINAKKAGTVKVNITVKDKGKTYKYKAKMTWYKYSNPLSSLTIGTKKINCSIFNKNTQASAKKMPGSNAVKIKLKSGYKIESIGYLGGGVFKSIKNGEKINFTMKGNNNTVIFIYYLDKNGHRGTLRLFAMNKEECLL